MQTKSITHLHVVLQILFFYALIFFTSCKKDEIVSEEPFFSKDCNIYSFYMDDRDVPSYLIYDNNELIGVGLKNDFDEKDYDYEFANNKLVSIKQILSGTKWSESNFEYGKFGLDLIRFSGLTFSFYDSEKKVWREGARCKFEYQKAGRPESMTLLNNISESNQTIDVFKPSMIFEYGYDDFGNLNREYFYNVDTLGNKKLIYTMIYSYDDKPNSLKQLYTLFFDVYTSAPYMFSTNNKIATKKIIPLSDYTSEQHFVFEYDGKGNVTNDGQRFSYIKWKCK